MVYWSKSENELYRELSSGEQGLSESDAKIRLGQYGSNEVIQKNKNSAFKIFINQFANALIIILIVAAIISFFTGEITDGIVILVIILLSAVLGFYQEFKAEKALQELRKFITINAKVLRDGKIKEINAKDLVPGDVVHLHIGDIIPSDIRLLHSEELACDESSLTGESNPVQKQINVIDEKLTLSQDLTNIAFMGTTVSSGGGFGIVIGTGKNTFFGKTATILEQKIPESEFEKNIKKFSKLLLYVTFGMTIFVFIANAFLGKDIFGSFIFALALAVGITPELLPIIVTVSLSNAALKMAKEKVIIKRLVSVEDLGNMDTLCSDKTGTLTEGKLALKDFIDINGKQNKELIVSGMLCNSLREAPKMNSNLGTLIDRSIWNSNESKELFERYSNYKIIDELEFDFERRRMSVLIEQDKKRKIITKGSPEHILTISNLNIDEQKKMIQKVQEYESQGYTCICLAEKYISKSEISKDDELNMNFLGFLLFLDPPKNTVKDALLRMEKLGVNIKIISGDSPLVTRKICSEVGLKLVEGKVITGDELSKLDDLDFDLYCQKYNVFSRVTPEQKYMIVKTLNKEGHCVGFLGDGINDVAAMRASDVGISVDRASGVAKEASDVIILQHNLHVLIDGIVAGRKTFTNITKYILNTISANTGNMLTVASSSLFLKFIPLLPSQILLNNFVSDIPLLCISSDNVDEESLQRPRKWDIGFIARFMFFFGLISTVFDLILILVMMFLIHVSETIFRTAWFVESALSEIIITFVIRTQRPFYKSKPGKWLLILSLITIAFTVVITYLPLVKNWFEFAAMPMSILALIAGVLLAYMFTAELAKHWFFNRYKLV